MQRLVITCVLGLASVACGAVDPAQRAKAREVIDDAIAYLRTQQDSASGGWGVQPAGQNLPAITGLVVAGMITDPRLDQSDPAIERGVAYMLTFAKPDGGIYDAALPSYNTSICLSALAHVRTPEVAAAIAGGQTLLRVSQYHEQFDGSPNAPGLSEPVAMDHPYYGGVGYGKHGRPDLSNTAFMLEALHDTGVSSDDPAFQRALTFLARTQMVDAVNDMPYADKSEQGGFVYATVPNKDSVDGPIGQSQAGEMVETFADGTSDVRLRAYGSMTYAGFKSLIYADLAEGDPRVDAAWGWIAANYTLDENPGLGMQGYYYSLAMMARALAASGHDEVAGRDWRGEMIDTLAALQLDDGSFEIRHDRWMESDSVLVTAYALIAIQHAIE